MHRRHEYRRSRSRGTKRSLFRRPHGSHLKRRHTSPMLESVSSDKKDNLSLRVEHNDFDGECQAGSPVKTSAKSSKTLSPEKRSSDSEEGEEPTISFAEAIKEVMDLLPPEVFLKKESSDVPQNPRSTFDALNPSDGKDLAFLPQSLLIKNITNLLQSLFNKKSKLEPG